MTLSAWLDDELSAKESASLRSHIETCATCREQVVGWVRTVERIGFEGPRVPGFESSRVRGSRLPSPALPAGEACPEPSRRGEGEDTFSKSASTPTCLDPETLVAYSEAELSAGEAARAEQHLQECTECVAEVQRFIALRVAMGETPAARQAPTRAAEHVAAAGASRWGGRLREWAESLADALRPRWAAIGAVAATALVVLAVARFVPVGDQRGDVQFRGTTNLPQIEVIADNAPARARPGNNEAIVLQLPRGTVATRLEESGKWSRIQLADGRRVWVESAAVKQVAEATR